MDSGSVLSALPAWLDSVVLVSFPLQTVIFCSVTLTSVSGGIAGSLVFREVDKPRYIPGLWACITASLLTIVVTLILQLHFKLQNRAADRGEKDNLEGGGPTFRYTL